MNFLIGALGSSGIGLYSGACNDGEIMQLRRRKSDHGEAMRLVHGAQQPKTYVWNVAFM